MSASRIRVESHPNHGLIFSLVHTRYSFKTILAFAVLAGILGLLFLGIGVVMYGRTGGKELAESLGVPRPAIVAHRGASYFAPEETAPAYLLAREMGVDYLELDLQRTKDGVLIAFHDDDLRRTTNIAEVFPGREMDTIDKFTFAELQSLDAGSWFNIRFPDRARASFKNVRILRLEDVMKIAEGEFHKPGLYIETKSARRFPGIEKQIVEILTARGWIRPLRSVSESLRTERARVPARIIFQSFEPDSLALLKELAPQVPAVLLIDETMMQKDGWDALLRKAKQLGVGIGTWGYRWSRDPGWSINDAPKRYVTTWPWYTGQAHRAGLLVHPWTVDDRWEMWIVSLFGADGFFTNRPELALLFYGRAEHMDLKPIWERIGY
ncbi:MAG TPA: glycerophosphodiester phosphodiesterase family protein [Candidatus Binatia bacterium]|nr:glycerophosphodiester phosphodiesterase family protein [Candidatus Binatia bacterium]